MVFITIASNLAAMGFISWRVQEAGKRNATTIEHRLTAIETKQDIMERTLERIEKKRCR